MPPDKDLRSIATKLLDFFGPDGERWTRGQFHSWYNHRLERIDSYCLIGGCDQLQLNSFVLLKVLKEEIRDNISIPIFNDTNDWETVKKFLMKCAHPYQPKK